MIMKKEYSSFDEHRVLHDLKHYLPAQAPLKDFIHHNTLHAFQDRKFHTAIRSASEMFGYRVSLKLEEYRELYSQNRVREDVLEHVIARRMGIANVAKWKDRMLNKEYDTTTSPRIGKLRANWKKQFHIDLDSQVHPTLFRILCSYLDQGISMWHFPVWNKGFLASIREMERNSYSSFFKMPRAKKFLLDGHCTIRKLLDILVGDEALYEQYLFDQQFAHQGWSGMVSAVESDPGTMLDHKNISLHDLILLELLMEIDTLDQHFGEIWKPISHNLADETVDLFATVPDSELSEVFILWQEAFEWTYYDEVLKGVELQSFHTTAPKKHSFQAMFCIDDRECSIRRHLEHADPNCETFGTPGFFGVEFYYKPEHGRFHTKLCPAPVTPKYLIKEIGSSTKRKKDAHFTKHSHSLFQGWLITQTLGFWSAFRLFLNLFKPSMSPATATSLRHMDKLSKLTIENTGPDQMEGNLQIGYTIPEMIQRVENLLKSIGLVENFAPIVYVVSHGSSSVNNPHYAAYDCGACSGRPGSVNARVICYMANHPKVREELRNRGINIPDSTQFVGALHDTTRDEVVFYDEDTLNPENAANHPRDVKAFELALDANAKERSRRLVSIDTHQNPAKIHEEIRTRSVSLFEPRPELNHATNALCMIGKRELSRGLFLDRRSFLNSYDYRIDPDGKYLLTILNAAAPVCGGINLEYYFSRVDNQKLGAGTKLPHNVMGLFGVANGIDGDLRPGLPSQMIEVHDPIRLLVIVEHFPEVVLKTIQTNPATYEWFANEWVHLVVVNPETNKLFLFGTGKFEPYQTVTNSLVNMSNLEPVFESHEENLPVYLISES
jgi:hypothetical protein